MDEQQKNVKRRRVEDATLRRFQMHWGDSSWRESHPNLGDWIDTSSLSKHAERALFEWSLNHLEHEIKLIYPLTHNCLYPNHRFP